MRIDLHVHSSERSACSTGTEEEMIVAGREAGLDALCFTDHNRLVPAGRLAELSRLYAPFRVFGGVEVSLSGLDHCLVIGVRDARLESMEWTYPGLRAFVREREGFLAVCHPYRFAGTMPFEIDATPGLEPGAVRSGRARARPGPPPFDALRTAAPSLSKVPPDAIELRSVHTSPDDEEKIRETAARVGAHLLSNSDAHCPADVGVFYNQLEGEPADDAELVALLGAGRYELRARDADGA